MPPNQLNGRGGDHAVQRRDLGEPASIGSMPAKPLAFMRDDAVEDPVPLAASSRIAKNASRIIIRNRQMPVEAMVRSDPDGIAPGVAEDVGEVFHDAAEIRGFLDHIIHEPALVEVQHPVGPLRRPGGRG